jgi:polyisoprenyl-teichoic acid--peptidoglycan teichoic acid transferase
VLLAVGIGSSYLWYRHQVAGANDRVTPEIRVALTDKPSSTLVTVPVPASPSAMNLLVLGSDMREGEEGWASRSDTIMLVHIDPDQDYLSIMSFPRDLKVDVPGYGANKLNYSFAAGGAALTIKTLEQLTGVDIDHYLEVDFNAFKDITDSLGGVYVDVDQRYYNDNPEFELIKLAPGYQLLKGDDALDYVRYRHDLNLDFGRMERQQTFLTAMREQAMGWDLPLKLPGLVGAMFSNVTTDLSANDFIRLAYWGVKLDGERMRRIAVVGDAREEDGVSYVFVDEQGIADAVTDLLTVPGTGTTTATGGTGTSSTTTTTVAKADLAGVEVDVLNANGRSGEAAAAGEWLSSLGATVVTTGNAGRSEEKTSVEYPSGQSDEAESVAAALDAESVERSDSVERVTVILGDDFSLPTDYALPPGPDTVPAARGWKTIAGSVPFAVQAPAYLPEDYYFVERMPPAQEGAYTYDIEVGGGTKPAFKMLYRLKQGGSWTDQYMGITETSWLDAPAASEGREVRRGDVTFTIVGTGQKVERIWWKADDTLYWISNTLFHLLSQEELLAVAESMIHIPAE